MSFELPKLCYTKPEAAQMMGFEETSIDWLLRKGVLPHRKIAGKIRFTIDDLKSLINQCAVNPSAAQKQKGA